MPTPGPWNDDSFRVVVAQSMSKTPVRPLYPLTEAGGLMVVDVLVLVINASNVYMPPPPPLPQLLPVPRFLPFPLPPPPLPPILTLRNQLPQRRSLE